MSNNNYSDMSLEEILMELQNQGAELFSDTALDDFVLKPGTPADNPRDGLSYLSEASEETRLKDEKLSVPEVQEPAEYDFSKLGLTPEELEILGMVMPSAKGSAPSEETPVVEEVSAVEEAPAQDVPVVEEAPVEEVSVVEEPVSEDDALADEAPMSKGRKRKLFPRGNKKKTVTPEVLPVEAPEVTPVDELSAAEELDTELGGEYADKGSEGEDTPAPPPVQEKKSESLAEKAKKSAISLLSVIALRVGGAKASIKSAPAEEAIDLGPEVRPSDAAKFYRIKSNKLSLRTKLSFLLTLILIYISVGLPVTGRLNFMAVNSAVCVILLLTVMLLGLDVISSGLLAIGKKRLNANSLVALSCLLSLVDGFIIACTGKGAGHPFCAVSALTVSVTLLGSLLNCGANENVFTVLQKRRFTLSAEAGINGKDITLLKSTRGTRGFIRRTEEEGPDEAVFASLAPFLIPAAIVLSLVACLFGKCWSGYFHVLSGIFVFAAPAAMLFSYSLPFAMSSVTLRQDGSCIAGWSGLYDMGKCREIIVTDKDLFEPNSVSVDKAIVIKNVEVAYAASLAGTLICAADCVLSDPFRDYMEKVNAPLREMEPESFKCLNGGGYEALIEGKRVVCGSSALMTLEGVLLMEKVNYDNYVYLAVDGAMLAIFEVSYIARKNVRDALTDLMLSDRKPVFATRDFNISPTLLSSRFGFSADEISFPEFEKCYKISSAKPSEFSRPAAALSRSGLGAYVKLAKHGRKLFRVIRASTAISAVSAIVGMLLVTIFFAAGKYTLAGVGAAVIYMLCMLVPEIVMALTFDSDRKNKRKNS